LSHPKTLFDVSLLTPKMGPTGCPETSVGNYHYSLRNNPEERSSHLLRGGGLKSYLFIHFAVRKNKLCSVILL
jgi:hypothetical protein